MTESHDRCGSELSDESPEIKRIKVQPHLVRKEAAAAWLSFAALCLLSALCEAPLEGPAADEGLPAEDVKAPWIFLGIQQMLRFIPPLVAGIVIPGLGLIALAASPWLWGASKRRRRISMAVFFFVVGAAALLTLWGRLA
jgi:quinol-cytochrome oxidoreductase complex cytochrome b subunit